MTSVASFENTPQAKKQVRWEIAKNLPKQFLPMHACLLSNGKHTIVISGPSASGKSTLSGIFANSGYKILANDFIVIWKNQNRLYAGDLNFEETNRGKPSVTVDDVIFLVPDDLRDVFRFNLKQAKEFYIRSLIPMFRNDSSRLSSSPLFTRVVKLHVCLGHRLSPDRWFDTYQTVKKYITPQSLGIIGMGTVGQDVANLSLTLPWLKSLNLYTTSTPKLDALALDFQSASHKLSIYTSVSVDTLLQQSDIVCITLKSSNGPRNLLVEERMARFASHAEIIYDMSRIIRKVRYQGTILMVTNPVDLLSACLYYYSQIDDSGNLDWNGLRSHQILGVGLGLDYHRLLAIDPAAKNEVIGPHGEGLKLVSKKSGLLYPAENIRVMELVKSYSERIRKGTERTRFGPSHEVLRLIKALHSGSASIRASQISPAGFYTGAISHIKNNIPQLLYTPSPQLEDYLKDISSDQKSYLFGFIPSLKGFLSSLPVTVDS